jgi:hypothetical protein
MGRQLKRVSLDFKFEMGEVWEGYLNPYYKHITQCEDCGGSCYSKEGDEIHKQWYGYVPFKPKAPFTFASTPVIEFAKNNVKRSPEHYGTDGGAVLRETLRLVEHFNSRKQYHLDQFEVTALVKAGRLKYYFEGTPTASEVNNWSLVGIGHDGSSLGVVMEALGERDGYSPWCVECNGEGSVWESKELEDKCNNWEEIEPPTGDGYQLWENTSEGSPKSPVFETLKELCDWCETNATTFADQKTTSEQWFSMLGDDHVYHQEGNTIFI